MKRTLRNIVAVLAGILVGSFVNMGIVMISGSIIPPPEGADVTTMEGLKESMHLFLPKHFLMPFLAHALGTFVGAFITGIIAATFKLKWAVLVGFLFLVGGVTNVFMLPSPAWFALIDIALAYIPMAYLGGKLALNVRK
ncbi:hypothetical protein [Echinicola sp. 20G]|uniref:hypothetical protein n=1 Tax=Echinicola sp. 20G TaxID=2781961 RepID=UPI00190FC651|nr:hypothetical protein [Echinicola sp. 20G]